jgi:hypothetical protein
MREGPQAPNGGCPRTCSAAVARPNHEVSSVRLWITAMPKNVVRKMFGRWLAHQHTRFRYPPRLVLQRKRSVELQFTGVTPAIRCVISQEGIVGIYARYQGEWWDGLADFDVSERRLSTGQYYCHACTAPERFPSRAALWVTHSFEPLLAWTNDHFQASQW